MKALKNLKGDNKLRNHVINYMLEHLPSYDNNLDSLINDLRYGCQTGIVSHLVYYSDTRAFYKKYKDQINELLVESIDSTGLGDMSELFGDKWDKLDPLALDTQNQNLLAWFGFEETAFNIANELAVEA